MGTKPAAERRYRCWPEALKQEIVAASLRPGASVATVARHYGVNANQVFAWRQRFRTVSPSPGLVPVVVTGSSPAEADARIEVELPGGYRLRVGVGTEAATLRLVLDVLERR